VDLGTALFLKDIAGAGLADTSSLQAALRLAARKCTAPYKFLSVVPAG